MSKSNNAKWCEAKVVPGSKRFKTDGNDIYKALIAAAWAFLSLGLTAATDEIAKRLADIDFGIWNAAIVAAWAAVAQIVVRWARQMPPRVVDILDEEKTQPEKEE